MGIKMALLAAMLISVLYNSNSPLKVMDNYFGITKENIQYQNSFVSNNGDSALYEVVFAYSNNVTQPGTNFFNEVYIIPDYLSSRKGEEAYLVSNIVIIKELSGAQSVGFMATGVRRDVRGFIASDRALIVPDDQVFAINLLRTLANDPKAPFGLKCINSKRFFDDSNMQFLTRSDIKSNKVHFLSEQFNP
ncbi:MAG: hypothetical protein J6Y24_06950 [Bacteroidales bacterium]|nr:hypothetical protein [Bacteroidales bacterium]